MGGLRRHTIHEAIRKAVVGIASASLVVALLCRSGLIVEEVVTKWGSLISVGMMTFNVIEAAIIIMTFKI